MTRLEIKRISTEEIRSFTDLGEVLTWFTKRITPKAGECIIGIECKHEKAEGMIDFYLIYSDAVA